MKKCSKCKTVKPFNHFHKNGSRYRPKCKKCSNKITWEEIPNGMKKCLKCNHIKVFACFHKHKNGFRSKCKDCRRDEKNILKENGLCISCKKPIRKKNFSKCEECLQKLKTKRKKRIENKLCIECSSYISETCIRCKSCNKKSTERILLYYKNNPEKDRERKSRRRARKRNAIPKWNESERQQIKKFYALCPNGHHIDHILPLGNSNDKIFGLHTLTNLQYLSLSENSSKSNKFIPYQIYYTSNGTIEYVPFVI